MADAIISTWYIRTTNFLKQPIKKSSKKIDFQDCTNLVSFINSYLSISFFLSSSSASYVQLTRSRDGEGQTQKAPDNRDVNLIINTHSSCIPYSFLSILLLEAGFVFSWSLCLVCHCYVLESFSNEIAVLIFRRVGFFFNVFRIRILFKLKKNHTSLDFYW